MTEEQREKANAYRLVVTLSDYANDTAMVQRLAAMLNYDAEQLAQDMRSVYTYIKSQECKRRNLK